jgi:hypothetical protein
VEKETTLLVAAHLMRSFADKVRDLLALGMVFGLACWAMWNGTPLGAYIAAGFAFFAYLWCRLARGERNGQDGRQRELPA